MPFRHARYVLTDCPRIPIARIPLRPASEALPWRSLVRRPLTRGAKRSAVYTLKDLAKGLPKETSNRKAKELPQGLIETEPLADSALSENEAPMYPAVLQQVRNHMTKYEDSVLLTKIGQFYELYFEHAEEYGPLLGLKVATRKTSAGPVAMAGFQLPQWNRYLKILVQDLHKQVAIADEIPNDAAERIKSGGLLFNREVRRIISAGTLIDENFISPFENNYLLAVHVPTEFSGSTSGPVRPANEEPGHFEDHAVSASVGLAWIDVTSGDFFTQLVHLNDLQSAVARIAPREIVLDGEGRDSGTSELATRLKEDGYALSFQPPSRELVSIAEWRAYLEAPMTDSVAETFAKEEIAAGSAVLRYVNTHINDRNVKLKIPIRHTANDFMNIDRSTLRALEIRTTLRDGATKGSLLHAVRRTVTPGGSRLLTERLLLPSLSLTVINERLDMVDEFLRSRTLRENVVSLLKQTYDTTRLVQKFSLGRGEADDLLNLAKSIILTNQIAAILEEDINAQAAGADSTSLKNAEATQRGCLDLLLQNFKLEAPSILAERILRAIDEDGLNASQRLEEAEAVEMAPLAQAVIDREAPDEDIKGFVRKDSLRKASERDGGNNLSKPDGDIWIMRRKASSTLKRLHESLDELWSDKAQLTVKLRDETDIPSLTLRWTPGLGHHIHVKGRKDLQQSIAKLGSAQSVSSSRSTHSFHHPAWIHLGGRIDATKLQIRAEEQRVFRALREQVVLNLVNLRRNAALLDQLDVACSFAVIAKEQHLTRPILTHSTEHKVYGGRHPTVDIGLTEQGRNFTPNDCLLRKDERIWLITGPNMAGKSTFLRQNALISILAQTGSFVPADYAEVGLVDQMFSRVGSADNLYQDQSTFMVEMLETAAILKQATPRSFVIMDEVGRGTTPEDGIAVGYACLHHLHYTNKCRTLFATHFHVLADKTRDFEKLACYCNDVVEDESGHFSYAHRMRKGVNRESHALKVARLAGLPEAAITIAKRELEKMKVVQAQ